MADKTPGFVHLHNHTTYSLLDGAQRIDEICARAAADGQGAVAITDHGNLFGVQQFRKKAKKHGVKPIIGIEAYMAPGDHRLREPCNVPGVGKKNYYHLILLAESYVGYKNLIQLSTKGYLDGFYYRPRIDKELLAKHSEGVVCLSACLAGEVPTYLRHDRYDDARRVAAEFRDLFGPERFWLEIQDHGLVEQEKVNQGLPKLAKELGIGLVASNDCHYLLPEDHEAHDVLVCIQTGKTVHTRDRMTYTGQHYFKTRAEMAKLFDWAPESIANSLQVAERCDFSFGESKLHLPDFPVPQGYDMEGYFEKITRDGLEERLQALRPERDAGRDLADEDAYRQRLDVEIKIIRQMGFPGYFMIVWDFVRYARENGIPVGPGRGSAAGSLVAYSLRITDIDPLQYNLLFERFLNPERVSMPDIDIDFCFRKRERVIDYVRHKYGHPNVAQIITFGTMAARAVIRDVGRGLEIPYAEVDKIAKLVPAQPGQDITIAKALAEVPPLAESYRRDNQVKELLDIAQRLEGGTRHASTHAAGVVIAPKPIVEYAPLYRGTKEGDEVTTQWDKDEIEEIGLLKMDFLGLKTLTLIEDCLDSIESETGSRPNLQELPLDDAPVYALFCKADTAAVFQFESEGMKDILRRLKPERFEDLIALNALYRPGPIGGGLIDDFIKRRHGKVKVRYPHKLTEEILRETYGVIVYQEQVMQIGSAMAGYTLGEADILRRAMGKKKVEVMEAEEKKFVERSIERGISSKEAKDVFELMAYFAGYGFNKSHSAAYALVAYHTAWLKAHYPVHFMSAVLTTEKGNTDKLVKYINACRDMEIKVSPPDVNSSGLDFTVEGKIVRFGLSAIKGVGEGAIQAILDVRPKPEGFVSLPELCVAVDQRTVNKRVLEALIRSGALDSMGAGRAQLEAFVDKSMEYGQRQRADREAGQSSLFGGGSGPEDQDDFANNLPDVPEWDERTRLTYEKATLGFYVSGHPLESFKELLGDFATHSTSELRDAESGTEVAVGGVISDLRRRKSKKGDWWASFQIEDVEGQLEVLLFPKSYEKCEKELQADLPVMIFGRYECEEERIRLIADDVCPLDRLSERKVDAIQVRVDAAMLNEELIDGMVAACDSHRGDVQLYFEVARPGNYRMIALAESSLRVRPSREFTEKLERLIGPDRIRFRAKTAIEKRVPHWRQGRAS